MRKVFSHAVYALLVLGGTMGASPTQVTWIAPSAPVFIPPPAQAVTSEAAPASKADAAKPEKAANKTYQVGKASWYGSFFQGRETASGDLYDMYDFTAAHRELPLGSFVRVTNLGNHKSVVVRINDRGPVTPGRIIDLSYSAARSIGMNSNGLQKVRIDLVPDREAEMAMANESGVAR